MAYDRAPKLQYPPLRLLRAGGEAFMVGGVLAAIVAAFASLVRLDRDRAFYPTVSDSTCWNVT